MDRDEAEILPIPTHHAGQSRPRPDLDPISDARSSPAEGRYASLE
jgi:hypothetical protein